MTTEAETGAPPSQIAQTRANWFHFIALSGEEGRRWVEQYQDPALMRLTQDVALALTKLREHQTETGRQLLRGAEPRLKLAGTLSPSIGFVAQRLYFPVLAYLEYCEGDFEAAERSLSQADSAVSAAIELHSFLLPLADSCLDFGIQRVRIARRRGLWLEMQQRTEVVWAMMEDRLPLCTLTDGRGIGFSALDEFYRSLPLKAEELEHLGHLLDHAQRLRYAERIVQNLYAIPAFVIPY